jgi:hypothetical protein
LSGAKITTVAIVIEEIATDAEELVELVIWINNQLLFVFNARRMLDLKARQKLS